MEGETRAEWKFERRPEGRARWYMGNLGPVLFGSGVTLKI